MSTPHTQHITLDHALQAYNQNRFDDTIRLIDALPPAMRSAEAAYIKAMALLALDRVEECRQLLRQANPFFSMSPDKFAMAQHVMGRIHLRESQAQQAVPLLTQAIVHLAENQACHIDLAKSLFHTNRYAPAQSAFLRALAIGPCTGELLKSAGACAMRQNRHGEAVAYFSAAWTMTPTGELAIWLAGAYCGMKEYRKAEAFFRRAHRLAPPNVDSLHGLASCYEQQRHYTRALPLFAQALAMSGTPAQQAELHRKMATCHERLMQWDKAQEHCAEAVRLEPGNLAHRFHQIHAFQLADDAATALPLLDEAEKIAPGNEDIRYARGFLQLLEGDWQPGWANYESRWNATHLHERYNKTRIPFRSPSWDGKAPLEGKLVMAFCEQGYGDYFNFVRYCRHLRERGATVDLVIPKTAVELMRATPWIRHIYCEYNDVPRHDFHVSLMSMMLFENTLPETVPPAAEPYIKPPRTRPRFSEKFTVGLTWSGDTENVYDFLRSIPDAQLRPLFEGCPDVQFVAIQLGGKSKIAQAYIEEGLLIDGLAGTSDFADTAAAIAAVDLLVSVDTANAHLAGAMHKPVWILLGRYTEWRWLKGTLAGKWYPTMRFFRQEDDRDWVAVLDEVARAIDNASKGFKAAEEKSENQSAA